MRLSARAALSNSLVVIGSALVILLSTGSLVRDRLESDASERLQVLLDRQLAVVRTELGSVAATARSLAAGPVLRAFLDAAAAADAPTTAAATAATTLPPMRRACCSKPR